MNSTPHTSSQPEAPQEACINFMAISESPGKQPGAGAVAAGEAGDNSVDSVILRVGQLTRALHDNLRELGYDKRLEKAAAEVPGAQDRLSYVAVMTEQAAERSLSATEIAKPIQDRLATDAAGLSGRWQQWFEGQNSGQLDAAAFMQLVTQTRNYLDDVPNRTSATNAQLMNIMMAQDFQDLTGQVIKKITAMVQNLEQELVRLLLDNIPADKRGEASAGLMNGPVVNPGARSDVVTNQNQVDDLLASLGF